MIEIEIKGIEEFIEDNRRVKKAVYRIKGENILREINLNPEQTYSKEDIIQLIVNKIARGE